MSQTLVFKWFVPDTVFQTICPRRCFSNDLSQTLFHLQIIVRITCRNDLRITCRNDLANLFNMTLYNNHLKHTMTYLLKSQYNLQITDKHDINNGKILPRFPSPCQARSTRPRASDFHFFGFLLILNRSEIHRKITSPIKRSRADFGAPSRSQRGLKITPSRINWHPDPPKIWKYTVFDLTRKTHRKLIPESMRFHGPEPRFLLENKQFREF